MPGGDDVEKVRTCTRCGAELAPGRSVCDRCGTLHRSRTSPTLRPTTVAPPGPPTVVPAPDGPDDDAEPTAASGDALDDGAGDAPPEGAAEATGETPAVPAPRPGGGPLSGRLSATRPPVGVAAAPPPFPTPAPASGARPRRRGRTAAGVALVVVLLAGAGTGAYLVLRDDGGTTPAATTTPAGMSPGEARLRAYQDHFCARPPRPKEAALLAPFTPGQPTVTTVDMPQAPNVPDGHLERYKVQVSPSIGTTAAGAKAQVGEINLATCIEQIETVATTTRCRYRDDSGVHTMKLVATRFAVTVYENSTGRKVTTGTLETPTTACPKTAVLADDGIASQPLTRSLVLAWLGEHFPGGQPT